MTPPTRDYSAVTEISGEAVRRDALEKMIGRYSFGAAEAAGKDVLEVACGSGQGLGLLAQSARRVIGGDYTIDLVRGAATHYGRRVLLAAVDAQSLPFRDGSFDLVLCYEALYYFPEAERFTAEAARVLRAGGTLIVVSVNPAWAGFNPSPHSTRYHRAPELRALLERHGFRPEVFGAFQEREGGSLSRVVGLVRRVAVSLHLVPKTMRAKRLLKRIFYGRLVSLPPELAAIGPVPTFVPAVGDASDSTVLYALGRR